MIAATNPLSETQVSQSHNSSTQEPHVSFAQQLKADLITNSCAASKKQVVFPTQGLPSILLNFSLEIAQVYGVPLEFPALSALCAVSASLRKKFIVDSGKYRNFAQLWLMFVAPPGVGKSEPMEAAFRPLQRLDGLSYELYFKELETWKKDCLQAKEDKTTDPIKPTFKQCLIDDFTPESLYQAMSRNQGAVSLYRDELSGWFSDFGRYSKNGEISRYLSIFNNAQFCINRKSEEPLQINAPFMTICGTIQPELLQEALNGNKLKENGFASRFLYVYPLEIKKQYYSEQIPNPNLIEQYDRLIQYCYQLPTQEQAITLSDDAKTLFIAFANEGTDLVNATTSSFMRASYAKMEIQVLRLALILHVIEGMQQAKIRQSGVIAANSMQYAIELCGYFCASLQQIEQPETLKQQSSADAIKTLLKEHGINNKKGFAESLGLSRQYVSRICAESV
jgi:Protein of unknown function (DUF3987)